MPGEEVERCARLFYVSKEILEIFNEIGESLLFFGGIKLFFVDSVESAGGITADLNIREATLQVLCRDIVKFVIAFG